MSRELKFRAWSKSKKEFFAEGFTLLGEMLSTGALLCTCFENGVDIDDLEITQWIGLEDTNGTDIYVGDLIKDLVTNNILRVCHGEYFDEGMELYGLYLSMPKSDFVFSIKGLDIEVIGNIYQTAEDNGGRNI